MKQDELTMILDKISEVQVTLAELNARWALHSESMEATKKDVEELKAFSNKAKGVLAVILAASSIAAAKTFFM